MRQYYIIDASNRESHDLDDAWQDFDFKERMRALHHWLKKEVSYQWLQYEIDNMGETPHSNVISFGDDPAIVVVSHFVYSEMRAAVRFFDIGDQQTKVVIFRT